MTLEKDIEIRVINLVRTMFSASVPRFHQHTLRVVERMRDLLPEDDTRRRALTLAAYK